MRCADWRQDYFEVYIYEVVIHGCFLVLVPFVGISVENDLSEDLAGNTIEYRLHIEKWCECKNVACESVLCWER